MNFSGKELTKILFLDVETVSQFKEYEELDPLSKKHWDIKSERISGADIDPPDIVYRNRAAIYAEFGKIVCISFGMFKRDHESGENWQFNVKSFFGADEAQVLTLFAEMLQKLWQREKTNLYLCGHNVREFDLPYICRRMIVNGLSLPDCLDLAGKKPWEIRHIIDTLELWKFGDIKHYITLELLAHILEIPTPKDKMDGSEVGDYFWIKNDLEGISTYCGKDVLTTALVFARLNNIMLGDVTFQQLR